MNFRSGSPGACGALGLIALAAAMAATASCAPHAAGEAQARVLRAADGQPEGYPTVESLKEFARVLEEETGGRLQTRVYAGRQLGEEIDTVEQTAFGAIDVNRINATVLNNIAPKTVVLTMPFLFRSAEHRMRVLEGPVGQEILDSLEPYGLVGLAYYDSGSRSLYTNRRAVRTPEDLRGLRIRVQNSDVGIAMIEALGGNATPMEFGQVYEALRNGAIDGAENNWPSFADTRHFEVADHYSLTEHSMVPEVLVMSKRTWDRLSADERAAVRNAAAQSARKMSALWAARVQEAKTVVAAHGNDVVAIEDKTAFLEAMAPVYERFAADADIARLVEIARETP